MKISKLFLYDEPSVPEIDLENLSKFIKKSFNIDVEIRKNIFNFFTFPKNEICNQLASCRIFDTRKPFERHTPSQEEIDFEMKTITDSNLLKNIIMYDGFEFQRIVSFLIPENERIMNNFHLIITNKLIPHCPMPPKWSTTPIGWAGSDSLTYFAMLASTFPSTR